MAEKKPNVHKTILILLLVFIPPFWLLFTDEGARVSDTALLWLLGADDVKVSIRELDSRFTESDIRAVYADIDWECGPASTPFGDSLCAAQIGTYNGYPSQVVTFFFSAGKVSAMKVIYREQYHEQVIGYHIAELGQPDNVERAVVDGPDADKILEWQLDKGVLVLKKTLGLADEPALLWLASRPAGS